MEVSRFKKNDNGFTCSNCGKDVSMLGYTSRDHCKYCLYSLHVDINPGDRANDCKGLMQPIDVEQNANKGYVIVYRCSKCGKLHKNKAAKDDDFDELLRIINRKTYKKP